LHIRHLATPQRAAIDASREAWRNRTLVLGDVAMQPLASRLGKTVSLLVLMLACSQAWSQYVWTDEKGVRQYSDRPPPASVPESRIIKGKSVGSPAAAGAPGANSTMPSPAPAASTATPTAPTAGTSAPSLGERNAEFNKRRAARAETEKKQAEQDRLAEQKKVNCERAASYKRTLESGARMARIGANGERVFPTEEERANDLREANRSLEDCKG
jgi:hypothetical protein